MNPMLLEWCFAREVCRRIGFTADEIFFSCSPTGVVCEPDGTLLYFNGPVIALVLRRGDLTFTWTIGPIDLPADQVEEAYERACEVWNEGHAANIAEFRESRPFQQAVPLMLALQRKGFSLRQPEDIN